MKKILILTLLTFCGFGQCFAPLEWVGEKYNQIFTDDYDDWDVLVKIFFSNDGKNWNESENAANLPVNKVFFVKIITQIVTDYTFDESKVSVPIICTISTQNRTGNVFVSHGSGDLSETYGDSTYTYKFNAIGRNKDASKQEQNIIGIKDVEPGNLSVEIKFENETLQKIFGTTTATVVIE